RGISSGLGDLVVGEPCRNKNHQKNTDCDASSHHRAFYSFVVVEISRLRLSTDSHVRATTYVYWSLCSSSQLRAISARASSRNWYQLCSKPSRRIALRNARKAPAP